MEAEDSPRSLSYAATVHMRGSQYRQRALAELAHSDTFFKREPLTWVDEFPDASSEPLTLCFSTTVGSRSGVKANESVCLRRHMCKGKRESS